MLGKEITFLSEIINTMAMRRTDKIITGVWTYKKEVVFYCNGTGRNDVP